MKRVFISLALMGLLACQGGKTSSPLQGEPSPKEKVEEPGNPFPINPLTEDEIRTVAARIGYVEGDGHPDNGKCIGCHQNFNSIDELDRLYNATSWSYSCFDAGVKTPDKAQEVLSCLATLAPDGQDVTQVDPKGLGFMAAGVEHQIFKDLFQTAGREADYEKFKANARMPRGSSALADQDFEKLLSWVLRYYPGLADFLTHDGPDVCRSPADTHIGSEFQDYVRRMSEGSEGWEHVNQARGLPMFACVDDDKHACFTQKTKDGRDVFPSKDEWKAPGLSGHMRILHQYDETTQYWIRSSADGRFVANGGEPSAIIDLQDKLLGRPARRITVEALYDPAFLPDNSAFMFQGDPHGSRICEQSILDHADLVTLDFMQLGCSKSDLQIGLYQAIGSSLDTGEIRTLAGYYGSDDGYSVFRDIAPLFGRQAALDVETIRRVNDSGFEKVSTRRFPTPHHGNWMMSPANQIAVAILSASTDGKARHGGYRLFLMNETFGANDQLPDWNDASTALLCMGGGEKPNISFNERMMTFYRYAKLDGQVGDLDSSADGGSRDLNSSADIYVYDLLKGGEPVALTQMPKGFYAQFPHFRSDGWLYFTVYNAASGERFVVATDTSLYVEHTIP
ncbi:hypothetical protein [Oligoflexus tunisiensis]|uniref:hypothetical protein n=1 Tax=Oligoflexus tunisiensis TaxID=708132 RepID=UPI00114D150F|nr:hypothetical protein [Oligoflexus tunisiensis]